MTIFEDVGANYTGPYISDGKFQKSVEFGEAKPQNRLDAASRLHDSLYAKYRDTSHRYLADYYYYNLVNSFDNPTLVERMAALAVMTLNRTGVDAISGLFTGQAPAALMEALLASIKNNVVAQDLIDNGSRYQQEIYSYLDSDPHRNDIDYQLGIRPVQVRNEGNSLDSYTDESGSYVDFSGGSNGFQGVYNDLDMGQSRPNEELFPGIDSQNAQHQRKSIYDPNAFMSAMNFSEMKAGDVVGWTRGQVAAVQRKLNKKFKNKKKNKIYMC